MYREVGFLIPGAGIFGSRVKKCDDECLFRRENNRAFRKPNQRGFTKSMDGVTYVQNFDPLGFVRPR